MNRRTRLALRKKRDQIKQKFQSLHAGLPMRWNRSTLHFRDTRKPVPDAPRVFKDEAVEQRPSVGRHSLGRFFAGLEDPEGGVSIW